MDRDRLHPLARRAPAAGWRAGRPLRPATPVRHRRRLVRGRVVAMRCGPLRRVPSRGGALITLGLVGVTFGLIRAGSAGWPSPTVIGALIGGLLCLGLFLLVQSKRAHPMLPPGIFRSRQFSAANAVTFVVYGALGGLLFLVPTVLQVVHGYSPVAAGTALLPVTFIMLALSSRSGALAARIGPRLQMSVGPMILGLGMALFMLIGPSGTYLTMVLPGVLVFGLRAAVTGAPLTSPVLPAAPPGHAG